MTPLPKRLLGTTAEERWMNQLLRCVEERTPLRSVKQRLFTGLNGFRTIPTAEEGESGTSEITFRGEYDQVLAYSSGDIVRVSVGPESGTYIALTDVPENPVAAQQSQYFPWSGGGYWVLIGRLADQSSWV